LQRDIDDREIRAERARMEREKRMARRMKIKTGGEEEMEEDVVNT